MMSKTATVENQILSEDTGRHKELVQEYDKSQTSDAGSVNQQIFDQNLIQNQGAKDEDGTENEPPSATDGEMAVAGTSGDFNLNLLDSSHTAPGEKRSRWVSFIQNHQGTLLALLAATFFALQGALLKVVADSINVFQLNIIMSSVLLVGSICLLIIQNLSPPKTIKQYLWLLPSGLSVSGIYLFIVLSYRHILYSDATAIEQFNIIVVGIFSWLIIREPFRMLHFFLAIVALVGVFCISRPTFIFGSDGSQSQGTNNILGVGLAISSAVSIALTLVIVRKQSTLSIHPFVSAVSNAIVVLTVNLILCAASGRWECPEVKVWLCIMGAGFFSFVAQVSIYSALAREKAPIVSIILTTKVIFAFILQFIIFRVIPRWTSWVGSFLIMTACITTLIKRAREAT